MTAAEIVSMIRHNVQIYDLNPLRDGFPDDPDNELEGPAILPMVQRVQRDLARLGAYYGMRQFTLEEGSRSVCVDGSLLHVYQVTAEDTNGHIRVLEPFSRFREDWQRPLRHNDGNSRIQRYDFFGMNMEFDKPADQDYIISILTDSLYTPLTTRLAEPAEIDEVNHDVFVDGGTYYIATAAMNMMHWQNQFAAMRYSEYRKRYSDILKICVEVARSRSVNDSAGPLLIRR